MYIYIYMYVYVYIYIHTWSEPEGGTRREPTTGGEGPTGDPHSTHTDRGSESAYQLAFTRFFFSFEASVHECNMLRYPRPPALATLLHYYCTAIAQYTTPLRPPFCMLYNIQYW